MSAPAPTSALLRAPQNNSVTDANMRREEIVGTNAEPKGCARRLSYEVSL